MKKTSVSTASRKRSSYGVVVESGILNRLASFAPKGVSKYAVVCDSNVAKLYGEALADSLGKSGGPDACLLVFPAGEKNKTLQTAGELAAKCLENGLDRKSVIIALGGGVTGDLAGFVASTYMRAIPFIQAPTTLLSMVDASIGGKTGVDLPGCKNCIGTFHQPLAVYSDLETLATLPGKELKNGLAESAKHAVMLNAKLFEFMEKNAGRIMVRDGKTMEELVFLNASAKAGVVSADERESEYRKVLNYGHTVGHALESLSGYKAAHGEAVAMGMKLEARIAVGKKFLSEKNEARQELLLAKYGLDCELPACDAGRVFEAMGADKKNVAGAVFMALPAAIGKPKAVNGKYSFAVSEKEFEKAWGACCP